MNETETTIPAPSDTINKGQEAQEKILSSYPANLQTVHDDLELMVTFAVDKGLELPNSLTLVNHEDEAALLNDYNTLRKIISPVSPESIKYIKKEMLRKGKDTKWYQVPVFTQCIIIAFLALVALIGVSLLNVVNGANQARGLLDSSGWVLFANLIFICAASLLGVMFYLLKTYADKIKNFTFVPSDALELNSNIIIGLIAGFVISELFSFNIKDISNESIEIQKMTLALLGGFSADAIFTMLQGVVNKFKAMFVS